MFINFILFPYAFGLFLRDKTCIIDVLSGGFRKRRVQVARHGQVRTAPHIEYNQPQEVLPLDRLRTTCGHNPAIDGNK